MFSCVEHDISIHSGKEYNEPICDEEIKSFVGQIFRSEEVINIFYKKYARKIGKTLLLELHWLIIDPLFSCFICKYLKNIYFTFKGNWQEII